MGRGGGGWLRGGRIGRCGLLRGSDLLLGGFGGKIGRGQVGRFLGHRTQRCVLEWNWRLVTGSVKRRSRDIRVC